jgi:hypothetical protein
MTSGAGTFRTWHDVRLESVMRSIADIPASGSVGAHGYRLEPLLTCSNLFPHGMTAGRWSSWRFLIDPFRNVARPDR